MSIIDRIKNEPVLVTGLVAAILEVAAAFGLSVTDVQRGAILTAVAAVLTLLGAGVARAKVTPARKVAIVRDPQTGRFRSATAHPTKPAGQVVDDGGMG